MTRRNFLSDVTRFTASALGLVVLGRWCEKLHRRVVRARGVRRYPGNVSSDLGQDWTKPSKWAG
ncbi:MAG: hypothetical protein HN341_07700 [Verrucomicrobia bacterium]|nr:hypothetical protein [Verrucomicrobiota bacterium]